MAIPSDSSSRNKKLDKCGNYHKSFVNSAKYRFGNEGKNFHLKTITIKHFWNEYTYLLDSKLHFGSHIIHIVINYRIISLLFFLLWKN